MHEGAARGLRCQDRLTPRGRRMASVVEGEAMHSGRSHGKVDVRRTSHPTRRSRARTPHAPRMRRDSSAAASRTRAASASHSSGGTFSRGKVTAIPAAGHPA